MMRLETFLRHYKDKIGKFIDLNVCKVKATIPKNKKTMSYDEYKKYVDDEKEKREVSNLYKMIKARRKTKTWGESTHLMMAFSRECDCERYLEEKAESDYEKF